MTRRELVLGAAAAPLAARAAFAAGQARPKMAAFVVGLNNYRNISKLDRAVPDAQAIARTLAGPHYGYDVELAIDVDADGFLQAQRRFLEKLVDGRGAAFCYIAGHGLQFAGRNYLLPVDADASTTDTVLETSFPLDQFMADLAGMRPAQSIVVVDACRNEPPVQDLTGQARGFAAANAPNEFYVAYSASSGEFAVDHLGDGDRDPNGLFMRHLLRHLSPDENFDDIVKRVRGDVYQQARTIGRSQHPAIYNQCVRDFCLNPDVRPSRAGPVAETGRMQSTAVLLVGVDHLPDPRIGKLSAPLPDIERLDVMFQRLGAATTRLANPDFAALKDSCKRISQSGPETVIVYFSGNGGLIDNEAVIFLPAVPGVEGPGLRFAEAPTIELVTAGTLLNLLAPEKEQPDKAGGAVRGFALGRWSGNGPPGPKIILLMDACLDELWGHELRGSVGSSLLRKLRSGEKPAAFSGVAMVYATGIMQQAMDAAEGTNSSPFAIALQNNMTVPGLTLAQFTSRVRDEVEQITSGFQTPTLLSATQMRDLVMVQPLATGRS